MDFKQFILLSESLNKEIEDFLLNVKNIDKVEMRKFIDELKASPEDSTIMSIYTSFILDKVFKNEYTEFFKLMCYYPINGLSIYTTYRIKDKELFVNYSDECGGFYNFATKPSIPPA